MKIAVTPRFELSKNGETLYSFEADLLRYIKESSYQVEMILMSPENDEFSGDFDVLILPGGATPGENSIRDEFELKIYKKALDNNKRIIGICRGAQFIGIQSGNRLEKVKGHINSITELENQFEIGLGILGKCFHNYGYYSLNNVWNVLAKSTEDSSIEMFISKNRKVIGIMSHPERYTEGIKFDELYDYLA